MNAPLNQLRRAYRTVVKVGGQAVLVADEFLNHGGGWVVNPPDRSSQIISPESLYVSLVGPAGLVDDGVTTELRPGQSFLVPAGTAVWANAVTSGHAFTAFFIVRTNTSVITPLPSPFPPAGPTGLTEVIPSYLYQQYTDDDDLQAFVDAENQEQQEYVDTFNALNLPIYSGAIIAGLLLDWVAKGVYGYSRPAVFMPVGAPIGALNTYTPNPLAPLAPIPINKLYWPQPLGMTATDDLFRRCLTWHYQKGDGRYFDVRWLKRRVMRFCIGVDGTSPPIDQTNQISVTFGTNFEITIRFVLNVRTVTGGAICNMFGCNATRPGGPPGRPVDGVYGAPNTITSTLVTLPPLPYMHEFQMAVASGALELPFQFRFKVQIG